MQRLAQCLVYRFSWIHRVHQRATLKPCQTATRLLSSSIRKASQNSVTVRWLDKEGDRGEVISEGAVEEQAQELQDKIRRLQAELGKLDGNDGEEEGDEKLDWSQARALREALPPDISLSGSDILDNEVGSDIEVRYHLPRIQRVHLQEFNKSLRLVSSATPRDLQQHRTLLWLQYRRCKQTIRGFLGQIPPRAWDILWQNLYKDGSIVEPEAVRAQTLVEDMHKIGRNLSATQKLVHVESLFAKGLGEDALKLWKIHQHEILKDRLVSAQYLELGISIGAAIGDLIEAEEYAMQALNTPEQLRPGHITPLITTLAKLQDEDSIKKAWSLYLHYRESLASNMKLSDFDQIVLSFLRGGKKDLALAVFKDLVLFGSQSRFDSAELLKETLSLLGELQKHSKTRADLDTLSLDTLAHIPRSFQNKFFYGSWIKRLIGMGETDAAASVLELMYQRGVMPDPKHLNGIVGSWLRTNTIEHSNLALHVGWAMVRQRLKMVAGRRSAGSGEPPRHVDTPDFGLSVPPYLSANLPAATVETFSILLAYYERNGQQSMVKLLHGLLTEAEIPLNAYFMNHLIYSELHQANLRAAWTTFNVKGKIILPDLQTFAALWDCEKAHLGNYGYALGNEFPGPRALFSRMMQWVSGLGPKAKKNLMQEVSRDFYLQVIRCFSLRRDIEGTLIALHAMKETFGVYPDSNTVRLIVINLSRLGKKGKTRKQRQTTTKRSQVNMGGILKILELITEERAKHLTDLGIDMGSLTPQQAGEEDLYRISELIRIFIGHLRGVEVASEELGMKNLEAIAWEMGTGALNMEAPF